MPRLHARDDFLNHEIREVNHYDRLVKLIGAPGLRMCPIVVSTIGRPSMPDASSRQVGYGRWSTATTVCFNTRKRGVHAAIQTNYRSHEDMMASCACTCILSNKQARSNCCASMDCHVSCWAMSPCQEFRVNTYTYHLSRWYTMPCPIKVNMESKI
jgi:hypothetical protein